MYILEKNIIDIKYHENRNDHGAVIVKQEAK